MSYTQNIRIFLVYTSKTSDFLYVFFLIIPVRILFQFSVHSCRYSRVWKLHNTYALWYWNIPAESLQMLDVTVAFSLSPSNSYTDRDLHSCAFISVIELLRIPACCPKDFLDFHFIGYWIFYWFFRLRKPINRISTRICIKGMVYERNMKY